MINVNRTSNKEHAKFVCHPFSLIRLANIRGLIPPVQKRALDGYSQTPLVEEWDSDACDSIREYSQETGSKVNRIRRRKEPGKDVNSAGVWLSLTPQGHHT